MAGTRQFDEGLALEKALNLFWKKGFNATSMLDLAKETGVQRGSLYNAYKSKTNIFVIAFDNYSTRLLKQIETSLQHPDLRSAINQFFESMTERLCDDSQSRGCLSTRTIMESHKKDKILMEKLVELLDNAEKLIIRRLDKAKSLGVFSGNTQETARYLIALSRGLAVIERVYGEKSRMQSIYRTAVNALPIAG
jgi:AcrR family transcriptional regulator